MRNLIPILFFHFVFNCNCQQIKLDGIDVSRVIVDDTIAVHQYLEMLSSESSPHQIKSKTRLKKRKIFKPKIEAREFYNENGKITYKVGYGWKGGDSSRVFYTYDTLGRIIEGINYNSIFGKEDEGSKISFEYDENGRVVNCLTKYRINSFEYNSNDKKEWLEILIYEYRYSDRRKNKSYLADSSLARFYYRYTPFNKLSCIVNSWEDTIVQFQYNEKKQLVEKNSFNIWTERYRYGEGNTKERDFLEHDNYEQDTILMETCKYFYDDNLLIKSDCKIFEGYGEDSVIEYRYNEKGLISEFIRRKPNGKTFKHKIYKYEYY